MGRPKKIASEKTFDPDKHIKFLDEMLLTQVMISEIEQKSENNLKKLTQETFREMIVEQIIQSSELLSGIVHIDGRHGADSRSDKYNYIEQKSRNVSKLNSDGSYTLSVKGFMFDKFNNNDKVQKIKLIDCMIFSVFYKKYCPMNIFILSDSGNQKIKDKLLGPLYKEKLLEFDSNKKKNKAGNDAAKFSVLDVFEWCQDDSDFLSITTYPANKFNRDNICIKNIIIGEKSYTRQEFFNEYVKNSRTYKSRNKQ